MGGRGAKFNGNSISYKSSTVLDRMIDELQGKKIKFYDLMQLKKTDFKKYTEAKDNNSKNDKKIDVIRAELKRRKDLFEPSQREKELTEEITVLSASIGSSNYRKAVKSKLDYVHTLQGGGKIDSKAYEKREKEYKEQTFKKIGKLREERDLLAKQRREKIKKWWDD